MKLFFFDVETTGTDFQAHAIHQLSGAIIIDNVVKEYFDFHVQPQVGCAIEEAALRVSGVTFDDLKGYPTVRKVYNDLMALMGKYVDKFKKTDKFYAVGYNNASFDNPFLRKWFERNGDNYFGSWFWSCPIDVMVLAGQHLMNERAGMIDFKLKTVAQKLGIVVDESRLHDATYDIDLTKQIYDIVTAPIPAIV